MGSDLTFSEALEMLKEGFRMTRKGWNGKGMYVVMQRGYPEGIIANENTRNALHLPEGAIVKVRPYLMMVDAQGMLVPWVASQTDILAEDWTDIPL